MPEDEIRSEPEKKSHGNGPNFLKKLLGKRVAVTLTSSTQTFVSQLIAYNRYEILVKDDAGHKVVMKHAIDFIGPALGEEDPFEVKPHPQKEEPS